MIPGPLVYYKKTSRNIRKYGIIAGNNICVNPGICNFDLLESLRSEVFEIWEFGKFENVKFENWKFESLTT